MHVDVDIGRIERQEQHRHRVAVARQHVGEGAADGAGDQLVAHRPAVDIGILLQRVGAAEARQRDAALERDAFAHRVDRNGIVGEVRADHVGDPLQLAVRAVAGRQVVEARRGRCRPA